MKSQIVAVQKSRQRGLVTSHRNSYHSAMGTVEELWRGIGIPSEACGISRTTVRPVVVWTRYPRAEFVWLAYGALQLTGLLS